MKSTKLEGETNDYLGKGLSGAKLIVKPAKTATYIAKDNVITGHRQCFFGGRIPNFNNYEGMDRKLNETGILSLERCI